MFPRDWKLPRIIVHAFCEMLTNQQIIRKQQEEIMSKLDDVKAKLAKLSTDVDAFIAANTGGASDADLDALGGAVDAIDAKLVPPATS